MTLHIDCLYLLLPRARRGQVGEGRGAQSSPRNRLPRQSTGNRSRRANRSRRSITSRREPFFPDDAVPAVSPTGCRCNCPSARNLRQGEAALAARMGSDIAVRRPGAFRRSPGMFTVRILPARWQSALGRRRRSVSIRRCPAQPHRAGTHSVCDRLDEDWISHDYLGDQITRLLLWTTMQRKISSYL